MKQLHLVFVFVFVIALEANPPGLHRVPAPVLWVLGQLVEGEEEAELAVIFLRRGDALQLF